MRYPEYAPIYFDPRALPCGRFGGKPPLNEPTTIALISIAASLAGAAVSYDSSQKQAKQVELNAEAQNEALRIEQERQAAEFAENQKRAVIAQKRQRAAFAASQASTGLLTGSGSQIALLAEEWGRSRMELRDNTTVHNLSQRELRYRGSSILAQGRNEASQIRGASYGTALSQLGQIGGQAYDAFKIKP
jgi:hypothetical protein